MKPVAALAAALLLAACPRFLERSAVAPTDPPAEAPAAAWHVTLADAAELSRAGRYGAADSALAEFAARYRGTQHAREIVFWRALYRLDPRNRGAQRADALAELDAYSRDRSVSWYRAEAQIIRAIVRGPSRVADVSPNGAVSDTSAAAKDLEIQNLRERLARVTDELDRIKRRLAAPQR